VQQFPFGLRFEKEAYNNSASALSFDSAATNLWGLGSAPEWRREIHSSVDSL